MSLSCFAHAQVWPLLLLLLLLLGMTDTGTGCWRCCCLLQGRLGVAQPGTWHRAGLQEQCHHGMMLVCCTVLGLARAAAAWQVRLAAWRGRELAVAVAAAAASWARLGAGGGRSDSCTLGLYRCMVQLWLEGVLWKRLRLWWAWAQTWQVLVQLMVLLLWWVQL